MLQVSTSAYIDCPDDRYRFCFQMVVLSFSELADVALRIIILEIHRIRSLMTKAIVRNLVCPCQTYQVFEADDIFT